ncbi:MAG: reverse transcriptase/maturase family protein [Bacteroidetes bacterium]|nr:reverse transcriptase/maturase family protein [Bacteroidota bacterium]
MQRHGDIYRRWCTYEAMLAAWKEVRKDKTYHYSVLKYEQNLAVNLSHLLDSILDESYRVRPTRNFIIFEPKERFIEAPHLEDRIVQHAITDVIRPMIEAHFIDQSYACRVGKGTHASNDLVKRYLAEYKNEGYYLRIDCSKFFYSISHQRIEQKLRRIIKCEKTLEFLKMFYNNSEGKGLPLGQVTSQLEANLALNDVDHFIKRELKVKHYVRYMDDMILLHSSKEFLRDAFTRIKEKIAQEHLSTNNKSKIGKISEGIDFVGYRTWYNRRVIRKKSLFRIKRKLKQDANLNRLASFLSHSMRTESLVYVIKQILQVAPNQRPFIEKWYRKHFKQKKS